MSARPALLVIADVAGCTRFKKLRAMSLVHAHDIVSRLLETEMDAAFFYLSRDEDRAADPA